MNWKRSIIFCVSFLVAFLAEAVYVFSCGPEPDPYDYYTSFYNPAIPAKEGFEPFYYIDMQQYYGQEVPEEEINLGEWHGFFSGKATTADIREFIYTYSRPQLSALYDHMEKGSPLQAPDSVVKNTLTKYFISSKDRETLGYLMYAKQCEAHANTQSDWDAPVRDSLTMVKLSRNGVQLYKACKNERIRERYAFQATRLAHYSRSYAQAIRYYDSLAAPIRSASLIHYKALALKAGALLRTGRKAESAYLFSRVFENAPSQREMAYLNTGWAGAPENEVMQHCTNNQEKAAVAALYAFRAFDYYPDGIRKVYRLFPQSPMLDVLLAREVNKLENGFLYARMSQARFGGGSYTSDLASGAADTAQVTAFQELLDSIANGGTVKEPALWHTSSAYLSFMLKDFPGARTRLAAAKSGGALRTTLEDQWEIVRLIVAVGEQPRIDKNFEAELLESFRWLDSRLDTARDANERFYYYPRGKEDINHAFYSRMYRNLLDYVIGSRYLQQGDVGRLALILSKRDKVNPYHLDYSGVSAKNFVEDSMQTDELKQLYTLQQQKKKTPFEQYLCNQFVMSESQVAEAIAIGYIRQHDFANAVAWFKKYGSSQASRLSFTDQLEDFGYDSIMGSHHDYAVTMLQLEKKIKRNRATAEDYHQYATGLFSISYYGHAYEFSAQYRPSTQWYTPAYDNNPMWKEYFGCYRAEEYYKKAADAATDREFKARCLFLAARCAQKHIDPDGKDYWATLATLKNPYFPELVKGYSNTGFYREITGQCGYLRDFVKFQQ